MLNVAYASVDSFVYKINSLILNPLIVFLFALALLYFLYGVFQFIANAESEEARTKGKTHIIWGVIGIVIMMGVYGVLNLIIKTFNIQGIDPEAGTVDLPGLRE